MAQTNDWVKAQLARGVKIEPETAYIWADALRVSVAEIEKAIFDNMPDGLRFVFDDGDDVKLFFREHGIISDVFPNGRRVRTTMDSDECFVVTVIGSSK